MIKLTNIKFLKNKRFKRIKRNFKKPIISRRNKELENVFEVLGYGSNLNQVKTNFTIVRGLAYYQILL